MLTIGFFLLVIAGLLYVIWHLSSSCGASADIIRAQAAGQLLQQSSRWLVAAGQDESPLIGVLHGQYGMGYLWAATDISNPPDIQKYTGINVDTFKEKAKTVQNAVNQRVVKACPQFAGEMDLYLGKIAGNV